LGTGPHWHMPMTLLSWENRNQIASSTAKLIKASQRIGLKINEDKTKYIIMSRRLINKQNLNIGQYTFEQVDNFKYLGVNLNGKCKQ